MAARTPRRSFANPFVVTLAAMPACTVAPAPPPQQPVVQQPAEGQPPAQPPAEERPVVVNSNPPPPEAPPIHRNPPPSRPPAPAPATYEQRWVVTRHGAACLAMPNVDCPKPGPDKAMPTCNPPPPLKYACPDGLADAASLTVVMYAGATECVVQPPQVKCPPNVACNPPRPRVIACPGGGPALDR